MQRLPERRVLAAKNVPQAIGPYSQAILVRGAGALVFLSGQIGLDPATGALVEGGVEEETRCALTNIRTIVREAGLTMGHVVKTTVYLVDLADFAAVNEAYERFFQGQFPARATVEVRALPRGARVEIDAIAVGH